MAKRRFRCLPDDGLVRSSKYSIQRPLPTPRVTPLAVRWLDCVAPISLLARKLPCAAPESVRALASVRDLRLARERTSSDALDLSPDTSDKLLRGRDLFSDLRSVDFAALYHKVSVWFHT